ncbi:MAG: S53 family peptidase [Gaiellales bacterium]
MRRAIPLFGLAVLLVAPPARAAPPPRVPAAAPVRITVDMKPRNPALLARLAASSSARPPLPAARVRALFYPSSGSIGALRGYLASQGLRFAGQSALSLSFTGNAASAERAFGVGLVLRRGAGGRTYRAPVGTPLLPPSLAATVADIEGLDTSRVMRPLTRSAAPAAVTPSCAGPTELQSAAGGYLPADLGAPDAYNHNALINSGFNGGSEAVAFVEFSNYRRSDVVSYMSCFGLTTPITDIAVGAGTTTLSGSDEVELDLETTLSAAPGLGGAFVYTAPPTASMSSVLNAITADQQTTGVHIVSISWGLCEAVLTPLRTAATNAALQLAAVQGISVFAASGDSGSYDCQGFPLLSTDDPASQPFATGVGGTNLDTSRAGTQREVAWNNAFGAGGGGISRFWTMPSWQAGPGVVSGLSSSAPCRGGGVLCREIPDVSLNATPGRHGYIVYCTTAPCGGSGWMTVGGTSAAAPLLAAITADANQYSLANGGARLGFANPFLYDRLVNGSAMFRDVTQGTNTLNGGSRYSATAGYDMATGIGSVDAMQMAVDLAAFSGAAPNPVPTTLTTTSPAGNRTVRIGRTVTFAGSLADTRGPVAGARVYLQGGDRFGVREWSTVTDAGGNWSITLGRQITRRLRWRAVYLGSEARQPAIDPGAFVFVRPHLAASAALPDVAGNFGTHPGQLFDFHGFSTPNLNGSLVIAELRPVRSATWTRLAVAHVGPLGRYHAAVSVHRVGGFYMRWRYVGSSTGQWVSSVSRVRLVISRPA